MKRIFEMVLRHLLLVSFFFWKPFVKDEVADFPKKTQLLHCWHIKAKMIFCRRFLRISAIFDCLGQLVKCCLIPTDPAWTCANKAWLQDLNNSKKIWRYHPSKDSTRSLAVCNCCAKAPVTCISECCHIQSRYKEWSAPWNLPAFSCKLPCHILHNVASQIRLPSRQVTQVIGHILSLLQ